MRAVLRGETAGAIYPTVGSGSEFPIAVANGSDDADWFGEMARGLLGKDAGLHLHYITGFPERTCYYYASGERKPPAYFLRALLRSEQGASFLRALMDGCTAPWWLDHQRAASAADKVKRISTIANE